MDLSNSFFPNSTQFLETCEPQKFPFPMSIMKYVWMNPPSSKVYMKMVRTCKLFFMKNPILVIGKLRFDFLDKWSYCNGDKCRQYKCKCGYQIQRLDMDGLKYKIWLTDSLDIVTNQVHFPNVVPYLVPKIYRSDVEDFQLYCQNISYNELKLLSNGAKECDLISCHVKYDNGEFVPLENIIRLFSGSKRFNMNFLFSPFNGDDTKNHDDYVSSPSTATCKSFVDLVAVCNTVKKVELRYPQDDFGFLKFYQQLKESKNRALIEIHAYHQTDVVDLIIAEIFQTDSFDFVPPVVLYADIDDILKEGMEKIQENEAAKYPFN